MRSWSARPLPSALFVLVYNAKIQSRYEPLRWSLIPSEADLRRDLERIAAKVEQELEPITPRLQWSYYEASEGDTVIQIECEELKHSERFGWTQGDTTVNIFVPRELVTEAWLDTFTERRTQALTRAAKSPQKAHNR